MRASGYLMLGGVFFIVISGFITNWGELDLDWLSILISGGGLLAILIGGILGNLEQDDDERKRIERNIILTPKGSPVPKTPEQKANYYGPRILLIGIIIALIAFLIEYLDYNPIF